MNAYESQRDDAGQAHAMPRAGGRSLSPNVARRCALLAVAGMFAAQASAQVTFYERENFEGRSFSAEQPIGNFERSGFNDRASSVVVERHSWEVCEDAGFAGRCMILRPGRYPSLAAMGLNDRISSVRSVDPTARYEDHRYAGNAVAQAAPPAPAYDYRRRKDERLYEARVTSVRAVVGPVEQRCWVERRNVVQNRADVNVAGAIVGAAAGGILGHQVGGGHGKDIATAGGAVAGAAIGANVGRDGGQQYYAQDVQRCATVPGHARADYWDVTYDFRGQAYRMQMTSPPGQTVMVNRQGEPRA